MKGLLRTLIKPDWDEDPKRVVYPKLYKDEAYSWKFRGK